MSCSHLLSAGGGQWEEVIEMYEVLINGLQAHDHAHDLKTQPCKISMTVKQHLKPVPNP